MSPKVVKEYGGMSMEEVVALRYVARKRLDARLGKKHGRKLR